MSRVSENSTIHSINYSIAKTKQKLEDLQLKGSNLKRVQKPSDDPIGNKEILEIRSKTIDGDQYKRNASVAKAQLTFTENAIEELSEIMVKAKQLAIGQSSNIFDPAVRNSVAKEVSQLHNQAIGIGNRRLGNKYVFAGFKTLTKPFNEDGQYLGDEQQTKIEVAKDTFVPITFSGQEVFYEKSNSKMSARTPLEQSPFEQLDQQFELQTQQEPHFKENDIQINRTPATFKEAETEQARVSVFAKLKRLENALLTNNHEIIQDLLPQIDNSIERLIEVRTIIGSTINKIDNAVNTIDKEELSNQEYKSKIEDADVAALFTDLTRQKNVLDASYKASAQMMNNNLMKYIN
ncbi:MAG: flagellar hook-associated protein FlgL [Bacteriovoracaceae bacterium]|jgi:flagellar hook-associated protein 3 FlgL|nr:flagellar hook-associated protein 3 [Halobacteriovoraceae bacterium]MDP7321804.1 flagellar hook-associated protein FlgL [Bacteriovoracaceae bacterium]